MKIIEALKEIPLIEKKIESNMKQISKYASAVQVGDVIHSEFKTAEEQQKVFDGLIQSTKALCYRRGRLRNILAKTNATVTFTLNGETNTITEWLEIRNKTLEVLKNLQSSLTTISGNVALQALPKELFASGAAVQVIKFYDEAFKNSLTDHINNLKYQIDTSLEMLNATTDLVEEVK